MFAGICAPRKGAGEDRITQQSTSEDAGAASQRDSLATFQIFPLKELLSTGWPEVWETAGDMVPPDSHLPALPWGGRKTNKRLSSP